MFSRASQLVRIASRFAPFAGAAALAASASGATASCESPARATVTTAHVARSIDHTILKPDARDEDIVRLCDEAKKFGFASVCVNPLHVKRAAALLKGSSVKVCAVVGFPLGASTTGIKVLEAISAVEDGADEVDMVVAVGKLKDSDAIYVQRDIRAVVQAAHERGAIVKVILETSLLSDNEIIAGVVCAGMAGADFVKTSTGFSTGGATEHHVRLMARIGNPLGMQVKASGGISTREQAEAMLRAGATRIGASKGVQICGQAPAPAAAEGSY